jgi:D-aminoacyl-tRNA deacylase
MRLIVTSRRDNAGSNIYSALSQDHGFREAGEFEGKPIFKKGEIQLISIEKSQIEAEHLDRHFTPEYYVFGSRHRSVSGERTLTVHTPGNLTDEAKVGGRPRQLAYSAPDAVKAALIELEKARSEGELDYKVSMEVTHHGPTGLKRPTLFVEVGSTEEEWNDPLAVLAVAKAAIAAAENKLVFEKGIGIGGNHYAPRHTRFILESNYALGHLVPAYSLDSFDKLMFSEALQKSSATFCFLDWKGMNKEQRERVLKLAKEIGVEIRKSISKSGSEISKDYSIYRINHAFFSMAEKVDSKRLHEAISENGGKPFEEMGHLIPKFAAKSDIRAAVLKTCSDILKPKKPLLSGKTVIFEEKRFDPKKAESLGLAPGPKFSQLKKGIDVILEDRTIKPEDVVTLKKTKIKLDDETLKLMKNQRILQDSSFK